MRLQSAAAKAEEWKVLENVLSLVASRLLWGIVALLAAVGIAFKFPLIVEVLGGPSDWLILLFPVWVLAPMTLGVLAVWMMTTGVGDFFD